MSNQLSLDVSSVPKEWLTTPCGVFFKVKSIKNTEGEMNLSVYRDYGVIPKDSRNDNHNRVSEDTSNYKLVEPGDFVLNKMKGWSGSLGVSDYRGIVSPSYTVLEPIKEIDNKYFHYLLRSETYRQIYESLSYGVRIGQWELRYHDFKRIPSLYPPMEEQKLISRYLDKKISQIDSLVDKVKKKIDLLKEQKTSLINKVVTKGLNPNVEMKYSGIEWVGKIPTDWDVLKLKRVGEIYGGLTGKSGDDFGQEDSPLNKPYIPYTNIFRNTYISREHFDLVSIQPEENQNNVKRLDLFFLMSSENYDDLGKTSILVDDVGELYLNSFCKGFRINNSKINPLFLNYQLNGDVFKKLISINGFGFTRINLRQDKLLSISILLPPLIEQEQIILYLDKKTKVIDETISKEVRRIQLLKEYNQSLISEVVTGKKRVVS